jgi:nucleotide-binding universal stress UspA family protein
LKSLINKIVVAVSGTKSSISAAKYAIVMAKYYHCKLSAVYVVDTATIRQLTLSKIFIQEESADYEKSLEANGNRYLAFVEELAREKNVKVERLLRKGAVYTEILSVADDLKADIILLGGTEKDSSSRDIIGHCHREILSKAKCSVLIVKERNIEQIYKKA